MYKKEINDSINPELIFESESKIEINKEELMKLLQYENKLRLDYRTKELADINNKYFSILRYIDREIRIKTLSDNGYNPSIDGSFKAYLIACGKYINDPEVREQVVWMKYDKARKGVLEVNSPPPLDFSVYDLNKKEIHFKKIDL